MPAAMIDYRLFGISVASTLSFPGAAWGIGASPADATVVVDGDLPEWAGTTEGGWQGVSDGQVFTVERSPSGEHRFTHGDRALFHLSADHRTLTAAPVASRDIRWWRILLDSVLFTVSLLRGNEALHAAAAATSSGAVAIVASSGGGKSTLLGQLLREGLDLVADDILVLAAGEGPVLAHPGPPLMTLPSERADGIGTPLAQIGDEVWAAVPVVSDAVPLRRVVLLDRRPGASTSMHRVTEPLAPLISHLLKFPRTRERELARFLLASALATQSEIWHLVGDVSTSPQRLAALVIRDLVS